MKKAFVSLLFFLSIILFLFLTVPVLKLITGTSPKFLLETLKEDEVYRAIIITLLCGAGATLFAVITGTPLAYILARYNFPMKSIVQGLVDLPLVIPHSSAGIALLLVFGRRFLVGKLFGKIGIDFVGTVWGIMIAMAFVSAPFYINAVRDGIKSIDERMEKIARTLGASPAKVFFKITLPLSWRSIITGSITMWARGISEFGAVIILAYHPMTAPVLVFDRFESFGLSYAKPVAALVLLISLMVFITIRLVARDVEYKKR